MLYKIIHTTIYTYNQPVFLQPHLVRLKPCSNAWQHLQNFSISVEPAMDGICNFLDLDGNDLIKLWFKVPTEQFKITVESEVATCKSNPFDFLLESWALTLPIDYPSSLQSQLLPYLQPLGVILDPVALELAQHINHQVEGNTTQFLSTLNQCLYENCDYIVRHTGKPFPPGITWRNKQGSCRDVSVLFIEVCRAMGLAARFVSGYQEGDPDQEDRDLHAWAEVYLPGGGWRGYDPTHGLAVSDRHIALAASPCPDYAAPVTGKVTPVNHPINSGLSLQSHMKAFINITVV